MDFLEDDDFENAGEIKKIVDKSLAIFFYGCNVSFATAEKPLFIQFIDTLVQFARKDRNFTYKPPCRNTLANSTL